MKVSLEILFEKYLFLRLFYLFRPHPQLLKLQIHHLTLETVYFNVANHSLPMIDFTPFFATRILAFRMYFPPTRSSQNTYPSSSNGVPLKSTYFSHGIIPRTCSSLLFITSFISLIAKIVTGEILVLKWFQLVVLFMYHGAELHISSPSTFSTIMSSSELLSSSY